MDEKTWLTCEDPWPMLQFMRGRAGARKLRLFAVACARQLWGPASEGATAAALAAAEFLADGGGAGTRATLVRVPAGEVAIDCSASDPVGPVWPAGGGSSRKRLDAGATPPLLRTVLEQVACGPADPMLPRWLLLHLDQAGLSLARQAELLRDMVRGPFRPIFFQPSRLRCNNGAAPKLAQAIYQERAFDRLPVLADAVEEAGCDDDEVLGHLRGPGPHTRGCWPLDLVLGKG
jgi:hypothetical protein